MSYLYFPVKTILKVVILLRQTLTWALFLSSAVPVYSSSSALSLFSGKTRQESVKAYMEGTGVGLNRAVCVYRHTQPGSGAHLHECALSKWLTVGHSEKKRKSRKCRRESPSLTFCNWNICPHLKIPHLVLLWWQLKKLDYPSLWVLLITRTNRMNFLRGMQTAMKTLFVFRYGTFYLSDVDVFFHRRIDEACLYSRF